MCQMRWRKKGAFNFNRAKHGPINKVVTKRRRKAMVHYINLLFGINMVLF